MTANRIVTTDSYNCKSISSSLQPLNPVWEVGKSKSGCCVSKKECILRLTCSLNPSYYDSWCYLLSWLRGLQITSLEQPEALDSENSQGRGHTPPPSIYSLRTSTESQPHLPWHELGKISSLVHNLSYCYNVVPPSAHVYREILPWVLERRNVPGSSRNVDTVAQNPVRNWSHVSRAREDGLSAKGRTRC